MLQFFQSISWFDYLKALLIVVIIYYIVIALAFYRKEIFQFFSSRKKPLGQKKKNAVQDDGIPPLYVGMQQLVKDVNQIIDKAGEKPNREQLITTIKDKIKGFDGLKEPAYKVALYNHIINKTKATCGEVISAAELEL